MNHTLHVELSDEAFQVIQRQAQAAGTSPAKLAAESLEVTFKGARRYKTEAEKEEARQRFKRHIGEVDLGYPTGADNEAIDADLAREYADNHEDS